MACPGQARAGSLDSPLASHPARRWLSAGSLSGQRAQQDEHDQRCAEENDRQPCKATQRVYEASCAGLVRLLLGAASSSNHVVRLNRPYEPRPVTPPFTYWYEPPKLICESTFTIGAACLMMTRWASITFSTRASSSSSFAAARIGVVDVGVGAVHEVVVVRRACVLAQVEPQRKIRILVGQVLEARHLEVALVQRLAEPLHEVFLNQLDLHAAAGQVAPSSTCASSESHGAVAVLHLDFLVEVEARPHRAVASLPRCPA